MRLIIGGRAQGKLSLLLREGAYQSDQTADGETCSLSEPFGDKLVFDHFHILIRRMIQAGMSTDHLVEDLLHSQVEVVLCDEVGNGVVPIQQEEEAWREAVGRCCCALAKQAEQVDRIYCGLLMPLKSPAKSEGRETVR